MKKIILLGMIILSSSLSAETLKEAMQSAYETNSKLRAKIYEHFTVQENMTQARAGFRPSVAAAASIGRTHVKSNAQRGQQGLTTSNIDDTDSQSIELSVKQNLFKGFGDISNISAAQNEIDASYYDYVNTEQEVILAAVSAYANVIFRQKSLEFNNENEKFLNKQLEAVTLAKDVGEKTSVDVSHAKAGLAEARAKRINAKGELANARANYKNVIGHESGKLAYPERRPDIPKTLNQFLAIVQQKNPKIRQAQFTARQAKFGIDIRRSDLLPSLDLEGKIERDLQQNDRDADGHVKNTPTTLEKSRQNSGSVRLQLTVPLYNKGTDWSQLRQANHKAVEARLQLQQTIKDVVEEASKAWENWVTAKESIEQRLAQVDFSTISRDGAFLGYEVGETSYLDALDAQNKLLEAQEGLEEARKNEVVQYFTILAFMGELTHHDTQLNVKAYPIKEHYEHVKDQWIAVDTSPGADIEKVEL